MNSQNNINVVLKALGVDSLLTDDYYWSSSLGSQTNPWRLFFTNAYSYNFGNDLTENHIRPVIAYTQNSCSVGDVLYSDRTCSDVSKLNSDKTAIGVVFSPDKKLAIALNSQTKTWTGAFYDVPGINNVTIPTTDLDGKTNTKTLVEFSSANQMSFPAASYAYSYTTQGTSTRDWYLPAGAELQLIFNEKEKLNETLSALGAQILENSYFWSSSEYATKYAWRLYFGTSTSTWQYVSKNTQCLVRPVLQY